MESLVSCCTHQTCSKVSSFELMWSSVKETAPLCHIKPACDAFSDHSNCTLCQIGMRLWLYVLYSAMLKLCSALTVECPGSCRAFSKATFKFHSLFSLKKMHYWKKKKVILLHIMLENWCFFRESSKYMISLQQMLFLVAGYKRNRKEKIKETEANKIIHFSPL